MLAQLSPPAQGFLSKLKDKSRNRTLDVFSGNLVDALQHS
jgi:hypothetical protein